MIGKTPGLLNSGRHHPLFYRRLWDAISLWGHWRGEIWNRRKSGAIYPQWTVINAVRDESGVLSHFIGVFSDVSDLKDSQDQIERLAHRDPLTNLPNRLLFRTRLEQALASAKRGHSGGLKDLPFDVLKIDQSFIRGLPENQRDMAIARAVNTLGAHLGMEVLAEGVETIEHQEALLDMGCHRAQGYLFSRPVPAEEIPAILRARCRAHSPS